MRENYWTTRTIGRRTALRAAAAAGGTLAALSLVGCGGGGSSGGAKPAGTASAPTSQLDGTKGKPGGKLRANTNIFPTGLTLIDRRDNIIPKMAGLVHSGLLAFAFGTPAVKGNDATTLEGDLAQALPEQQGEQTYVFKLRPGAKFHNGRAVTSEDIKYSYERYATYDKSVWRTGWTWLDKVETPDPQTVTIKTAFPFAEALQSMSCYTDGFILAKEHEEGPDVATKLMGSGPYIFVGQQPPLSSSYRKNPDYYLKPYPYFDEIELFASTDAAKRVADFSAHNLDVSWWNDEATRDELKRNRPDAQTFFYPYAGHVLTPRNDKAPFNDKRVRQALSMSINRKAIREAVVKGEGEDDQVLSVANESFGFRKPKDLGAAAKYWNYDPAEAKKLMSAAGVDKPIETSWTYGMGIGGNATQDIATLTQANWRSLGIANIKDNPVPGPQASLTVNVGNFEGLAHGPGSTSAILGYAIWQAYAWPAVERPALNLGWVKDPKLGDLALKQLQQVKREERLQTFRQMEDILAEEQYRISFTTVSYNYFADPSVKNARVPLFHFTCSGRYMKDWWFDKA